MIEPLKKKYHLLYWDMAIAAAEQSECRKLQVGCVIVTPTGMLSVGWNGLPSGFEGDPETTEDSKIISRPEIIHAERNAIDKMTRQGVPTEGSILFTTHSPCLECAKSIHGVGFSQVYYLSQYRSVHGIDYLKNANVPIEQYNFQ